MLPALILWTLHKVLYYLSHPHPPKYDPFIWLSLNFEDVHLSFVFCHKCLGLRLIFLQIQAQASSFRHWTLKCVPFWRVASAEQKAIQHCWVHSWSSGTIVALLVSVKAHSSHMQCWNRATDSESTKWKLKCFIIKFLISILPKGYTSLSVHSFFSLFACCPI